ncbi:permease [Streptomyces verrucosisporus]|uniref:permease n=1 Tax=Streptomyces verrucosisporus TaxID=1695161 RepID=UPI0019D1194D|nr:permease [Streptomyces verrucosisporus]MBN3931323.1 permease [Streptomyces verrucosisporus]
MPDKAIETIKTFGTITAELVVLFLLVAFLVALIQRRIGEKRLQAWMEGGSIVAPLKGALLGSVTPFCSCSTLPMLMGMIKAGSPFTGAAAFLIASPLLNPIILGVIWILFSWEIMLGYAAVVLPLTIIISLLWGKAGLERYVRRVKVSAEGHDDSPWQGLRREVRPAARQSWSYFQPLMIPLLIGVSIGAVIYGVVPQSFLISVAGDGSILAVPIAALIGIPLYIRTESILPIGLALSSAGMGLGPVFALVIGGAGASIPELTMLSAIFKPRLVATFVGSVLAVAIAGGLIVPLFAS